MSSRFRHDPQAVLDYTWDWTDWLVDDDEIVSYTLTAPHGITIDSHSRLEGAITAWMRADVGATGLLGIVCHIVTAEGREDDRTLALLVIER